MWFILTYLGEAVLALLALAFSIRFLAVFRKWYRRRAGSGGLTLEEWLFLTPILVLTVYVVIFYVQRNLHHYSPAIR